MVEFRVNLNQYQRVRAHRGRGVGRPARYDRSFDLPRLLPLWPAELADRSASGRASILAKLRQALRAERQRGIAGHWTYDVARHVQLAAAYRCEQAELRAMAEPSRRRPIGVARAAAGD